MSLTLGDLPHDPEQMLQHLRRTAEIVAAQSVRIATLEVERDTVLAERDTARAERDLVREERDAAQAEIDKLRLLIRQLQRGRFGRRSEKLDPDQLQLGLEDLEQNVAAAEAAQEDLAAGNSTPRPPRPRRRNLGALPAHLPRVETLIDVEDQSCPCCGVNGPRSLRSLGPAIIPAGGSEISRARGVGLPSSAAGRAVAAAGRPAPG
jgi:chromosome segregation ATPase